MTILYAYVWDLVFRFRYTVVSRSKQPVSHNFLDDFANSFFSVFGDLSEKIGDCAWPL